MLFTLRNPIVALDGELPARRFVSPLETISNQIHTYATDLLAGLRAGTPRHQGLARLAVDLLNFRLESEEASPYAQAMWNRSVGILEQLVSHYAPPLVNALAIGGGLSEGLGKLMSDSPLPILDDSDIVFSSALGIPGLWMGTGSGAKFFFTPLRRVFRALELLQIGDNDIVLDLGGACGLVSVIGANCFRGQYGNVEVNEEFAGFAEDLFTWATPKGRADSFCIDFLKAPLPRATRAFAYEPVTSPRQARTLVDRTIAAGVERVTCYSPEGRFTSVRVAFSLVVPPEAIEHDEETSLYTFDLRSAL